MSGIAERTVKHVDRRFLGYNVLLVSFVAAVLFAIAAGAFVFGQKTQQLSREALRAGDAARAVARLVETMVDAETGQRGFLLTRDLAYLVPYDQARRRFETDVEALGLLLADLPESGNLPDPARLKALGERKFAELDHTIELERAGDTAAARALVHTDLGKTLMDDARRYAGDLSTAVTSLRASRVDEMRKSAEMLTLLTVLGVVVVVVVATVAVTVVTRHTRELEAARAALGAVNEDLEARVNERTGDLTRANDEIQRYAYIVSHDLRAPLVNIMGFTSELETATATFSEFLKRCEPDRSDPRVADVYTAVETDIPEALVFIRTSMVRMDGLINEILKLSRLGRVPLTPEPIDLPALIADCVATVQHRLDAEEATAEIVVPLPTIVSDASALKQIVTNLLDNAAKYLHSDRPGRIVVRGRRLDGSVLLEIEDNGRGIAPADHERIFELFRRAGVQDRPGDGIGLAHVRSLVRRLGGEITVVSDGRTGTVFQLILPVDLPSRLASEGA